MRLRYLTVCCGLAAALAACTPGESTDSHLRRGDALLAEQKLPEAIFEFQAAVQLDANDGQARLRLGRAFAQAGDYTKAMEQTVRAADLLPSDAAAQVDAGNALLRVGRFEDARTRSENVLKVDSKNVDALVLRANASAGLRETAAALQSLEEAVKLDPKRSTTYTNLAIVQASQGAQAEAEAGFKQAIAVDPKSVPARIALANFYWLAGRRQEAEQAFIDASNADPTDVRANLALANLYRVLGRGAEAEAPLKRAVEKSADLGLRLGLADFYVSENRLNDARPILEELAKTKESAAAARSRLAGIEYEFGNRPAAHKMVDDLLREQPGNVQVLLLKGNWLLGEKKLSEALATAQAATVENTESGDPLFLLGSIQMAMNDPDAATQSFTSALQKAPREYRAYVMLANLNVGRGRADEAEKQARQAVNIAPRDADARLALARALFAQGKADPALVELKPIITAFPDAANGQALLGRILQQKGDVEGARQAYTKALEANPASPEALTGLVNLDLSAKRRDAAVRQLETRLAKAADSPAMLLVAGRTYAALGNLEQAEAALQKAIDTDPTMMDAYVALGQVLIRQKKIDQALKTFLGRVQNRPNDVTAHTMIGLLLYVGGKPEEARTAFERTLAIDPRAAVAANNLAYMDAEAGTNLDVALARAQVAKTALPDNPDVNDTLGWVYVKRNLGSMAVPPLEQAALKVPDNPGYHYHLGVAYSISGNIAKARESLERAIKLAPNGPDAAPAKKAIDGLNAAR